MAIPATEGAVSGLSWPLRTGCVKSAQSGREGLLAMKQRGFTRPAKLAVGDGVLGGAVGSVSIHPHAALLDAQDWGWYRSSGYGYAVFRSRPGRPH